MNHKNALITIKEINVQEKHKWDDYVQSKPNVAPYLQFAWGEAIHQAYGHTYSYFAAFHNQKVVGVLPLIYLKPPFRKAEICSLPFCDIGGCLADTSEIEEALLSYAKNLTQEYKASQLQLRVSKLQAENKFTPKQGQKVSMILPLPSDSETLFNSFKSKLRSQIRKAEKNGLTVELGNNRECIDAFYHVFSHNMHRLGSPVHSKSFFQALSTKYKENMIVSVVKLQDTVVGAGIVLLTHDCAVIPWASTHDKYNKLAPNMLLYWSLLEFVSNNGIKTFDFGRSSFGEGTYKFKKQWGAQPQALTWRTFIANAELAEKLETGTTSKLRSIVENIWRHLPLKVANFVGPKIRKYISL